MKIHDYARQGDIAGVQRELAKQVLIDVIDDMADLYGPQTPLQYALASPIAGLNMVEFFIAQGAVLTLEVQPAEADPVQSKSIEEIQQELQQSMLDLADDDDEQLDRQLDRINILTTMLEQSKPRKSDLHWAIRSGKIEKVQLLLHLGADLNYVDENGYDALLDAIFSEAQGTEKIVLVQFLLEQGVQCNGISRYGESALSVASRRGWFDLVQVLLDAGCDRGLLGWTNLMQAIALGSLSQMEAELERGADLTAVDDCSRNPWLLSLARGDVSKANLLLEAGADPLATGRCGKLPLMYAIESGNRSTLAWLLELSLDVNATDEFGQTALMLAVELDQVETAAMLLKSGAVVSKVDGNNQKAINQACSVEMIELLLAAGEDLSDIGRASRHLITKVNQPTIWELDAASYKKDKYRRFGTSNPEKMDSAFWREMVKFRCHAYRPQHHYGDQDNTDAVWCFERFGQSITRLPDGRILEIAGEHEDYCDPDFCIYNDVVVYDGQGDFNIYGYPASVFPPTDFHTATLVDDWIYIIGNLGYADDRVVGNTPVYRLNCNTLEIEPVITSGDAPSWISSHRALLNEHQIHISGGQVWDIKEDQPKLVRNNSTYILDVQHGCWHRA